MKKLKIMIAAILAASLTVSAAGCKPSVATQKETLGATTTAANQPVAASEKAVETTTAAETTTTTTEAETTTITEAPVQVEQGATVLDDLRNFKVSDFTDVTMKMDMTQGDAANVSLDMQIKSDGEIAYENIRNLDMKYSGTPDASSSFMSSMQFNMHDVETYKTEKEQYINEKGFCSMMETTTDLLIQLFFGMGTSMASESGADSGTDGENIQAKVQAVIDELHNVIQTFSDSHDGRYIKVTAEDLTAATQGMSINTSDMMSGFYSDFAGFADTFEPLKESFCSTDSGYNVFRVDSTNKDLFFDTLIEMDDTTLVNTMSFFLTGNSTFNTAVISSVVSSDTDDAEKAAKFRNNLKQMKDEVSDDYYYTLRTSTASDGYMVLEMATNYSAYQPTSYDESITVIEANIVITITGGMLNESLTLPSDDTIVEFKEWYEDFSKATESVTKALNGGYDE